MESLGLPFGEVFYFGIPITRYSKGRGDGDSVFLPLEKDLRCVFSSIVVRNTALSEKYPGGVVKFANKYPMRRNHLITVGSFMGLEGVTSPMI